MLALKAYRDTRCPGCSGNLAITTAPENEDKFKAELPLTCFRCVGFGRSRDAHVKQPHPEAVLHLVSPRPQR